MAYQQQLGNTDECADSDCALLSYHDGPHVPDEVLYAADYTEIEGQAILPL